MASKKISSAHLATAPARHWGYRAGIALLLAASASLLAMSHNGSPAAIKLRTQLADAVTPVLAFAASPIDAIAEIGAWFSEMADLRAQNIQLKNENRQLLQWQATAKQLEAENIALRSLANAVPTQVASYISARIVSDLGGPYAHSALLGAGTQHGVVKDQAVTNEYGLLGRIVEAGATSARLLLLGDMNSRIPVMIEGSHETAILAGSSNRVPVLTYLSKDATVAVGDRIITSGDGGIFPKGIAVGVVSAIEGDIVAVKPFADPAKAEFVSIVDYHL